MSIFYCSNCGEPITTFASILDVTSEFTAKYSKLHAPVCPGKKSYDKPGNLYFNLSEVLRNKST